MNNEQTAKSNPLAEITPEMIEAGAAVFSDEEMYDFRLEFVDLRHCMHESEISDLVSKIYLVMAAKSPGSKVAEDTSLTL
jgi:hypothetical protein